MSWLNYIAFCNICNTVVDKYNLCMCWTNFVGKHAMGRGLVVMFHYDILQIVFIMHRKPGNKRDLTFLQQIPARSPALQGLTSCKTSAI